MDPKFNSRKLFIAISLETLATVLLCVGKIDQEIWRDVTLMVGAAYLTAQAFVDWGSGKPVAKAP